MVGGAVVRRGAVVAVLVMLVQMAALIRPAWACGCGAMVPGNQTSMAVREETSAVRWDGRTEEILMQLTVTGDAANAAWIMPVPTRADLALGDTKLFSRLDTVVAPVDKTRHYFWPRDGDWPFGGDHKKPNGASSAAAPGAAAPPVSVVGSGELGPFQYAQLAATDPAALESWLHTNGFTMPAGLADSLKPYVDQGWEYVAVKLAPAANPGGAGRSVPGKAVPTLGGDLDPLKLTFASDKLVYPMRLSQRAKTAQLLRLFVFAPHRVEPVAGIGGGGSLETLYAGKPDPEQVRWDGGQGPAVFLTAMRNELSRPAAITGDYEFRAAPADERYQRVRYHDELLTIGGVPAWIATVLAVLLVFAAVLIALRRRSNRRRWAAYPPRPVAPPRPAVPPL
ncbi:DUF2330 domain-containing protein [Yinghuangia aomiensis]|uniref:DUF2330 domain-containing protein n=1 Tax=Yinghuangia aomiensis TaxID=676205 RepID=A0ABP9GUY1_9ACTN